MFRILFETLFIYLNVLGFIVLEKKSYFSNQVICEVIKDIYLQIVILQILISAYVVSKYRNRSSNTGRIITLSNIRISYQQAEVLFVFVLFCLIVCELNVPLIIKQLSIELVTAIVFLLSIHYFYDSNLFTKSTILVISIQIPLTYFRTVLMQNSYISITHYLLYTIVPLFIMSIILNKWKIL